MANLHARGPTLFSRTGIGSFSKNRDRKANSHIVATARLGHSNGPSTGSTKGVPHKKPEVCMEVLILAMLCLTAKTSP